MGSLDHLIFAFYGIGLLLVGLYWSRQHKSSSQYFVGDRNFSTGHLACSVVATDVGGGFSIGLGGLAFGMGLSGSWLLFTGLLGAWLSAVIVIPWVFKQEKNKIQRSLTLPELLEPSLGKYVTLLVACISAIGYTSFTGSQALAGAKLTMALIPNGDPQMILWILGLVIILYTALGGLSAVIYTDTFQWTVLLVGLIVIATPLSFFAVGGFAGLNASLPENFLNFNQISWSQILNWGFAIIPIWFIGMTLYQRILAAPSQKSAQKAWFVAGLLEWPLMALGGAFLGVCSRALLEQGAFVDLGFAAGSNMDPELGVPFLLTHVLPTGLLGLVFAAYISAVLSTADSCLMAASSNVQNDLLKKFKKTLNEKTFLRNSRLITLVLGCLALTLASTMNNVLDMMLMSYSIMVSGLLIPILAVIFDKKPSPLAAFLAIISGGLISIGLPLTYTSEQLWNIDGNVFGVLSSGLVYLLVRFCARNSTKNGSKNRSKITQN